jgi:protein TonB
MIAASRMHGLACLSLALAAHLGLAYAYGVTSAPDVRIAAGLGAPVAQLGTSFADLVEGTQTPEAPTPLDMAEPVQEVTAHAAPTAAVQAVSAAEVVPAQKAEFLVPMQAKPAPLAAPAIETVHVATELAPTAVLRSPRPMARPKDLKIPEPPQKPAATSPGNAARTRVAGAASGAVSAPPVPQGATVETRRPNSGSAAASNYPGKVLRCVSRANRAQTTARGTASVGFSVSERGRITGVYLAGSSGNPQLDAAALRALRSVGRCPAPPQGARTS